MKITETMMDEVDRGYLQTVLDYKNYINPYKWPKKHYKSHNLNGPTTKPTDTLPFKYEFLPTGLDLTGKCICRICGEVFDMTDYKNI